MKLRHLLDQLILNRVLNRVLFNKLREFSLENSELSLDNSLSLLLSLFCFRLLMSPLWKSISNWLLYWSSDLSDSLFCIESWLLFNSILVRHDVGCAVSLLDLLILQIICLFNPKLLHYLIPRLRSLWADIGMSSVCIWLICFLLLPLLEFGVYLVLLLLLFLEFDLLLH